MLAWRDANSVIAWRDGFQTSALVTDRPVWSKSPFLELAPEDVFSGQHAHLLPKEGQSSDSMACGKHHKIGALKALLEGHPGMGAIQFVDQEPVSGDSPLLAR